MRKQKPGPQGLANLKTWRLPFSDDVKNRRRQKHENRRPHRLRSAARPDSVLGFPELHWTEPPRLGRTGKAINATPKRRGAPMHEPVFFARNVRRVRRRSLRPTKNRP